MSAANTAASIAARMRDEPPLPDAATGVYRRPDAERLAIATAWIGYRVEIVTRVHGFDRYVFTGPVVTAARMRLHGSTGSVIVVADPRHPEPTALSLAVVDSIRGARP